MSLDSLSLSSKHHLKKLLLLFKSKRERHLKELDHLLQDVKSDSVDKQQIFSQEEVVSILEEFQCMVKDSTRSELETAANMSAVYASDLYRQAEAAASNFCGDVGSCEEEAKLRKMGELLNISIETEGTQSMQNGNTGPNNNMKLASLTVANAGSGGEGAVSVEEVNRLTEENKVLTERYQVLQKQVLELLKERSSLSGEYETLKGQFLEVKSEMTSANGGCGSALANMEAQLANTKEVLESKNGEIERIKEVFVSFLVH